MRIKRAEFITSLTGGQHIPGGSASSPTGAANKKISTAKTPC